MAVSAHPISWFLAILWIVPLLARLFFIYTVKNVYCGGGASSVKSLSENRAGFTCILIYTGVKVIVAYLCRTLAWRLCFCRCMCSEDVPFCLWYYLNQNCNRPQFELSVVGSISQLFYLYHSARLISDFNSSLRTFLKGLLHEMFSCFVWLIYTDLYCT